MCFALQGLPTMEHRRLAAFAPATRPHSLLYQTNCSPHTTALGSASGRPQVEAVSYVCGSRLMAARSVGLSGGREQPDITRLCNTDWVSTGSHSRLCAPGLTLCAAYHSKNCLSVYLSKFESTVTLTSKRNSLGCVRHVWV